MKERSIIIVAEGEQNMFFELVEDYLENRLNLNVNILKKKDCLLGAGVESNYALFLVVNMCLQAEDIEVLQMLKKRQPVLALLAGEHEGQVLSQLMDVGVNGVISIRDGIAELGNCIEAISTERYFSVFIKDQLIRRITNPEENKEFNELEKQILYYSGLGYTNEEIAVQLRKSKNTISAYKSKMMRLHQVSTFGRLLQKAKKMGMLSTSI